MAKTVNIRKKKSLSHKDKNEEQSGKDVKCGNDDMGHYN